MLTKEKLNGARKEIEKLNEVLKAKFGIEIEVGRITYSDESATGKLKIFAVGAGESKEDVQDKADFEKAMHKYGLEEADRGKLFDLNGTQYRLVTLRPKAPKWPFIVEDVLNPRTDGKRTILRNNPKVLMAIHNGRRQ